MSKGLEAFNRIKSYFHPKQLLTRELTLNDLDTIEEELKEYEKMKVIKGTTTFDKAIENTLINACPDVAKKLKALDIIKKKEVQIATLILSNTCNGYNFSKGLLGKFLTEEEYDLLKEVLL